MLQLMSRHGWGGLECGT